MSAFGGKADIVRGPDHTSEISLQICEGGSRQPRSTNFGVQSVSLSRYDTV